jgi:hypothetical protein
MNTAEGFYRNIIFKTVIFSFIIVIPSVRLFLKIDLLWLFPIYLLVVYFIFFNLKAINSSEISKRMWWLVFILLVAALSHFIYPVVSLRSNPGSTGDDAVRLSAQTLRNSAKLYDVEISPTEPISPGPAWILFNSPFVLFNLYWLFGAGYVAFAVGLLRRAVSTVFTNIFCLFMGLSMVFAELLFNGHDLLPLSMAMFSVNLLIMYYLKKDVKWVSIILISLFLGIVASSRIVFGFLPIMYFLLLKNDHRRNSYMLLIISSAVFILTNVYFFLVNDNFQPGHLIFKGITLLSLPIFLALVIIGIAAMFYLLSNDKRKSLSWNWTVFLVLSCPLIPLAYADLINSGYDFKYWEGANYLIIPLPFFILNLLNDKQVMFLTANNS